MGGAQQELTSALVRLASEGRRPICGDWRDGSPWLSDDRHERAYAAILCQRCPVLSECAASADEAGETFGVWGGTDRTRTPSGKGARK